MNINLLFFISVSVSFLFLLIGFLGIKFPPKKANWIYGYRTKRAMQSQYNWDFAQQYSAKASLIAGLFFLIASIAGCFFIVNNGTATIIEIVLLVITLTIIVLKTENKLKRF